jgi:hypothetical protein
MARGLKFKIFENLGIKLDKLKTIKGKIRKSNRGF